MPSNFKKYQTKFKILLKLFYDRIDKQKLHKRPNCQYLNKIKASIGRKDIFKFEKRHSEFLLTKSFQIEPRLHENKMLSV